MLFKHENAKTAKPQMLSNDRCLITLMSKWWKILPSGDIFVP